VDHDRAGNMIVVPKADGSGGYFLVQYDAWGRMTGVYEDTDQDGRLDLEGQNPDQPAALYRYDPTGRRILKQLIDAEGPDDYVHFYHSGQQVVETRTGDDSGGVPDPNQLAPRHQFVWSPRYIDSLILRDENTDGDGTCTDADDQRLFYLADANYNVTAVVAKNPQSGQWQVAERYVYDPYGRVTVLNGDPAVDPDGQGDPSTYPEWSVDPGPDGQQGTSDDGTTSDVSNTTLYTGRELDPETRLYYYRARYYHPHLGRFLTRDPLLYRAGDKNLYRYVANRPAIHLDPRGLAIQLECSQEQEGRRIGRAIEVKFVPGTENNPDEEKWAINAAIIIAAFGDVAAMTSVGDMLRQLDPNTPKGIEIVEKLAEVKELRVMLKMNAGYVSVWTKLQCYECRCTNWFPRIWGKIKWGWVKVGKERWVRCDLSRTEWGQKQKHLPGRIAYNDEKSFMLTAAWKEDIVEIKEQCAEQAKETC